MDYMIVYKWTHVIGGWNPDNTSENYTSLTGEVNTLGSYARSDEYTHWASWSGPPGTGSNGPPGIINSLICMAMGQQDFQPLFEGGGTWAAHMMLGAVISVPWILLPKPIIL